MTLKLQSQLIGHTRDEMKISFVSKFKTKNIEATVKKFGFDVVRKNPDFVLCYGGDGTVLLSERIFPGIPKIIIKRGSALCRRCDYTISHLKLILEKIIRGKYKIVKEIKLTARSKNKSLTGLNEIQVHNKILTRAIRFSLKIDGRKIYNLLGDGVIFATPFGSTAYYSSTGGKPFKKGIGISFNNLHYLTTKRKMKSFVVSDNSKIEIKIKRGPAWVFSDNDKRFIEIDKGDKIIIQKSKEFAKFVFI